MSLHVIATPIGNPKEISLEALELIKELDVLICESRKETSRLLRQFEVRPREYEELSEHSDGDDQKRLLELCRVQKVGLVSDCGTPGFCDPGARLVKACRKEGIPVKSVPGPSSLMAFLSVCGEDLHEFFFKGFLSQKTEERQAQIRALKKSATAPTILMDTPYRLKKLLADLQTLWPESRLILGCQIGLEDETFLSGTPKEALKALPFEKAEFILLVIP